MPRTKNEPFEQLVENRVLPRIDTSGECWVWTGAKASGRGQVAFKGKVLAVTRVVWEYHNGPIPPGMFICHKCDNPPCCRLDHLFVGSPADNMRDMMEKGRANPRSGPQHHNYRLSDAQVVDLRERSSRGESTAALAAEFGIHISYVRQLVKRQYRRNAEVLA